MHRASGAKRRLAGGHALIDTHCHLHHAQFQADREAVKAAAFAAGVTALLEVNIDAAGFRNAEDLANSDARIFLTVGIHPHDTERATDQELAELARHLDHPRVCAVGETGLDYFRDYAPRDRQRDFFRRHVALARESGLPLVVHAREKPQGPSAHADIFEILEEEGRGQVRGVLHCFSGDLETARRAAGIGFKLGLGGAITYAPPQSGSLIQAIARSIGADVFLLETDCPYLSPVPKRGRRNEPSHLPWILEAVARYLGRTTAEVEALTDAAARELFRLDVDATTSG